MDKHTLPQPSPAAHTPGLWRVVKCEHGGRIYSYTGVGTTGDRVIYDPESRSATDIICTPHLGFSTMLPEMIANLYLIAAAPEMLAALKVAEKGLANEGRYKDLGVVQSAIAKAEGAGKERTGVSKT